VINGLQSPDYLFAAAGDPRRRPPSEAHGLSVVPKLGVIKDLVEFPRQN